MALKAASRVTSQPQPTLEDNGGAISSIVSSVIIYEFFNIEKEIFGKITTENGPVKSEENAPTVLEEIKEQLTHEKIEELVVTNDAVMTEEADKDVIAKHEELEEKIDPLKAKPQIDWSKKLTEVETLYGLKKTIPSLPIATLLDYRFHNMRGDSYCATFPKVYELNFNNMYWQQQETSNGTFFLLNAYLDVRERNRNGPTVRIMSTMDRIEPQVKAHCQLWFDRIKEPIISEVFEYKYMWFHRWGNYRNGIPQPYILSCKIPETHWKKQLLSVSIVEDPCTKPTNMLKVHYNLPEEGKLKEKFGICVKGLTFPDVDLSLRIIEWIELLKVLGAHKIFFYEFKVHPNITKVLNHYVETGFIEVTPTTLSGFLPNEPDLNNLYLKSVGSTQFMNELVLYNDCFYKNMYRYEFISVLDIDEVMMPKQHDNWEQMMKQAVLDSIQAMMLHNHWIRGCLDPQCPFHSVNTTLAQLQHYRNDCAKYLGKRCQAEFKSNPVRDESIWRWKDKLISSITGTLNKLGFYKSGYNW